MQAITIVILIALSSAILISYAISVLRTTNLSVSSFYTSSISDSKGDAKLIALYKSQIIPEVRDFHDILAAKVKRTHDNKLVLSLDLAGDPNKNQKYETVYLWVINYTDSLTGNTRFYTVIIPNFPPDSNFKTKNWNLAIFDNVANAFITPLSKLPAMPIDKVEAMIDPILLGNPSFFDYRTSVMIRVNSTFLSKPPDYLIDSAPDSDTFWLKWFA